jgi:hypothetical protein
MMIKHYYEIYEFDRINYYMRTAVGNPTLTALSRYLSATRIWADFYNAPTVIIRHPDDDRVGTNLTTEEVEEFMWIKLQATDV